MAHLAASPARLAQVEDYLINEVGPHFRATGKLSTEDFWLILIWKANRAKNNHRRRFERDGTTTMDEAVKTIAENLHRAVGDENKLSVLMKDWGMRLPTATAILTMLYPDQFSVYDIRVCDQLSAFHKLAQRRFSQALWKEYQAFLSAVVAHTPDGLTLRERDHYL